MKIHLLASLLLLAVVMLPSSCSKDEFGDYAATDIDFPQPGNLILQPATAEVGSEIKIQGVNLGKTIRVIMGSNLREATIVSRSETELVVRVPRTVKAGPVRVETAFKKFALTTEAFTPIYPLTRITTFPVEIERTQAFKLKGENIDLLTSVNIAGQKVVLDGGSATATEISIPTQGLTLPDAVVLSFEALGGVDPTQSPSIPVVDYDPTTKFEPVPPLVLWDFEDGINPFASIDIVTDNGINSAGVTRGRGENYLSVMVDDVPDSWGTNIGNMRSGSRQLSGFHKPHLSFLVNTNGKSGYFQLEVSFNGVRGGGHFTGATSSNPADNYTFATNGWEWRSIDLSEFPFEDWWGDGAISISGDGTLDHVEFFFKQGNGTDPFEISLDQVMITDGPVKPVRTLFDFENGVVDFENSSNPITGINLASVPYISGNRFFTVTKEAAANWDWTGAITGGGPLDMAPLACPFLNIWVNTGANKGYFQIETFQDGTKWGIGQTSPDYLFDTGGNWQLVSIDLKKAPFQNWGGTGTEIDWLGLLDYLKVGFTTGNAGELGTYEISVDDIILSDGPMF